MSEISFEELAEYHKDLKQLLKKFRSLTDDISELKKVLAVDPDAAPPYSYRIEGLGISTCVIKVKKIACRSLKGRGVNSGLRLVYAWFEIEKKIVMVEIYHKNEREVEDKGRIMKYFR